MIPAAFDYVVADSVDHAIELLGEERGREAPRGRALAPPGHEASARPAGAPRRHRADGRPLLRPGGRRHDRDRRTHAAQGRRGLTAASRALPDRLSHGRPGRRPAGPPPRHDRRLARARRSRLRPPDGDPRADGELVARGPGGDRAIPARDFFTGVFQRRSSRTRCSWRSASPSSARQAGRTRRWPPRPGLGDSGRRGGGRRQRLGRACVDRAHEHGARPRCGRPPPRKRSPAGRRSRTPRRLRRTEPSRPTDHAASSDFRKHLARVLTRRALEEARSR